MSSALPGVVISLSTQHRISLFSNLASSYHYLLRTRLCEGPSESSCCSSGVDLQNVLSFCFPFFFLGASTDESDKEDTRSWVLSNELEEFLTSEKQSRNI